MFRFFCLYLVAFLCACGGCGGDGDDGSREERAFQRCEADEQCGSGGACVCGLCSASCESDDACGVITDSVCTDTETANVMCEESQICLIPCERDGDCQEVRRGLVCREGTCSYPPSIVKQPRPDGGTVSDMRVIEDDMGIVILPCEVDCFNGGICSEDRSTCFCPQGTVGDACEAEQAIRQVAAGSNHLCAIFSGGTVKCWGDNLFGQLGLGHNELRVSPGILGTDEVEPELGNVAVHKIAAGVAHTCGLFANGRVKCWGDNTFGQLGYGDMRARGDHENEMGEELPFLKLGGRVAVDLVSGGWHNCVTFEDGDVACWGLNDYGQLGDGSRENRGDLPNQLAENTTAVDFGARVVFYHRAAGNHHCALFDDKTMACWGQNSFGQLGTEDAVTLGDEPGELGEALQSIDVDGLVEEMITRGPSVCARLESGLVKCWGFNGSGQLGQNDVASIGDEPGEMGAGLRSTILPFPALRMVAGAAHVCAVLADDGLRCWGANQFGQLGQGHDRNIGTANGEMESMVVVPIPSEGVVTDLVAGADFSCALIENAQLYCWGDNSFGQLGTGTFDHYGDNPGEIESLTAIGF